MLDALGGPPSMSADTWVVGVARVTDDDSAHPGGETRQELLAYGIHDDDPLHADARLSRRVVPTTDDRIRGGVEVGVCRHDERRIGPELEQDLGRRSVPRDLVSDGGGPGEGHRTDPAVRRQRHPHFRAAGHQLDSRRGAAGRCERLPHQVHEPQRGEWGLRGRLCDDRATRRQRRSDLVGGEQQRVVEPGDAHHDADGFADPEADQPFAAGQQVERHGLTVQPGDLLGGSLQREQRPLDFDAAVHEWLAGLQDQ
jgi:hypothetical protein